MIKIDNNFSKLQPLFAYLKKKSQNRRFIKSVETSVTFFAITFFLFFAIRPTAFTISELVGDIKAKKILSQQKMKPKINSIIAAQDSFASIQKEYFVIESSLPSSPRFSHLATQILASFQTDNVSLDKISFNLPDDKKKNSKDNSQIAEQSYGLSLNFTSDFKSANSLISHLLNNRRLVDFQKISFSRDLDKQTGQSDINVNLSLNIPFWQ